MLCVASNHFVASGGNLQNVTFHSPVGSLRTIKRNMQRSLRMKKEIEMLSNSPPYGISCWPKDDKLNDLEAQIIGGAGTPYEGGLFKLEIQIPERYPFEPPKVRYLTPIYHPNIDNGGRICLDTLKMPPKGAWKPCLNISTVLTSLQLLMAEPNPEDPLMTDISNEFKYNKSLFNTRAKQWTQQYAMDKLEFQPRIQDESRVDSENCNSRGSEKGVQTVQAGDEQVTKKRTLCMTDVTNKRGKPS